MDTIGKQELIVDVSASKSLKIWKTIIKIAAWIVVVVGVIIILIGEEYGFIVVVSSLSLFFLSALLKGIKTIVEVAEYKKAKVEEEYVIKTKDSDGY